MTIFMTAKRSVRAVLFHSAYAPTMSDHRGSVLLTPMHDRAAHSRSLRPFRSPERALQKYAAGRDSVCPAAPITLEAVSAVLNIRQARYIFRCYL